MKSGTWNHNIHYYDVVLRSVPDRCQFALDVGCGTGLLACRLAQRSEHVMGIESDPDTLARAKSIRCPNPRIWFVEGDVMTYAFPDGGFDLVSAVAVLHHLPLRPALARFRDLLRPGGVLAVIGLYRSKTAADVALDAVAVPTNWFLRMLHGYSDVAAPTQPATDTLREIRMASEELLPGATLRRHLLFRYSLVWRKPGGHAR